MRAVSQNGGDFGGVIVAVFKVAVPFVHHDGGRQNKGRVPVFAHPQDKSIRVSTPSANDGRHRNGPEPRIQRAQDPAVR